MTVVRIPKQQLKKGMYVESVECPSLHFDKRRFILALDEDLDSIVAGPAEFVIINKAKSKAAARRQRVSDRRRSETHGTLRRASTAVKSGLHDFLTGQEKNVSSFRPIAQDMIASMSEGPALVIELTRLKSKDEATFLHSMAVGAMMAGVGQSLGAPGSEVEELCIAGILHDFGKLLVPDMILKKPGSLDEIERQVVRNHPELGYQRLVTYPDMPQMVLDVCRDHHENLDGTGYPRGLKDDELTLPVRIATVCDVFDALTSVRPYKKAWSAVEALSWMFGQEARFDRKVVLALSMLVDTERPE